MRLISWFFIILNFMEYIGSQNASRGRRHRRSKCRFSTRLLPPAAFTCRVAVSSGVGSQRSSPAALPPTPPGEVAVRAGARTAPLTPSSALPALPPHPRGGQGRADLALPWPPPPRSRRLAEKFGPSSDQLQRCVLHFRDSDGASEPQGAPAHEVHARGGALAVASAHLASAPRVGRPGGALLRRSAAKSPRANQAKSEREPARRLPLATREWSRRAREALRFRVSERF